MHSVFEIAAASERLLETASSPDVSRRASLTSFDSICSILSKVSIFGGVTDAQRSTLFRQLEVWVLRAGEVVFNKGDEPLHIYIVKRGEIDLQLAENAVIIHKHQLQVGECFGEASLMCMHKHTARAVAAVESEIIVLSRRSLIDLRHENVELFALLMMNLARELARRLYITDQMLLDATGKRSSAAAAPQNTKQYHESL